MKVKRFECNACADTENTQAPCVIMVPVICPPPQYCPGTTGIGNSVEEADWVEISDEIMTLVNKQANDVALWSVPTDGKLRLGEAYLQQELRKLHTVIKKWFLK